MTIAEEFFVERKGVRMVLYGGLLQAAHDKGLKAIRTKLLEHSYGEYAVVSAVVEGEDGTVFEGIGDASAGNVGKMIAPHLLRMAETRAKARALRDFVNIGVVSLEETGGEDEPSSSQSNGNGSAKNGKQGGGPPSGADEHEQVLEEIAQVYERLPGDQQPDKDKMWPYARDKVGNARKTLDDLKAREGRVKETQGNG